mmetsp:Transcript_45803/g.99527  ORF Transcript_45803/g.99527 Transcript_45803/m.99527 type:complete len:267 (+) Transcript_45803:1080-1880(+)
MVVAVVEGTADNFVPSRVSQLACCHPGIGGVELSDTRPSNRLDMGCNTQALRCNLQSRGSHSRYKEARNHTGRQNQPPSISSGDRIGTVTARAHLLARSSVVPSQRVELAEWGRESHYTFTHFASHTARPDRRKERAGRCPAVINTGYTATLTRILSLASCWIVHTLLVPCNDRNQVPPLFQRVGNLTVAVETRVADLAAKPQIFQERIPPLPPAFVRVGAAALAGSSGAALGSPRQLSYPEKPTNHQTLCGIHRPGRMAALGTQK